MQDELQGDHRPARTPGGNIWLSDTVKIDSGAKDALVIAIGHSLGIRGPLAHSLAAKLIEMGDAPLSASITLAMPPMPDGTSSTTTSAVDGAHSVSIERARRFAVRDTSRIHAGYAAARWSRWW